MSTLYVVHSTAGGFAREDASQSCVEGAYTDPAVARKVAAISGGKVAEVVVDAVPPGYVATAQEMGFPFTPPSHPALLEKFESLYQTVADRKNYVRPAHPQMDGWSVDRYERNDGYFAGMTDAGYYKFVGRKLNGKVLWRVSCAYNQPGDELRFDAISKGDFLTLEI